MRHLEAIDELASCLNELAGTGRLTPDSQKVLLDILANKKKLVESFVDNVKLEAQVVIDETVHDILEKNTDSTPAIPKTEENQTQPAKKTVKTVKKESKS